MILITNIISILDVRATALGRTEHGALLQYPFLVEMIIHSFITLAAAHI